MQSASKHDNANHVPVRNMTYLAIREIDSTPHTSTRVGHDAQATFENSCHDGNVGAVPQQVAVAHASVCGKSTVFAVTIHTPHVTQPGFTSLSQESTAWVHGRFSHVRVDDLQSKQRTSKANIIANVGSRR